MPFHCFDQDSSQLIVIQAQPDELVSPSDLFPTVASGEFEKEFKSRPRYFSESSSSLRFTQNICVVKVDGKTILVDVGIPTTHGEARLISGMTEAGISPSDIDLAILTHRDLDHIGGTVTNGQPTFPNARYIIGQTEYESYKNDPVRNHFQTYIAPIEESGHLDVVDDDAVISDGVRLFMTPGHRAGATSVIINDAILISADVWHCAFQVTHPDWQIKWDSDPAKAVETRSSVIDLAEQKGYLISVPHTPFFGVGRIVRENQQQVWQSLL